MLVRESSALQPQLVFTKGLVSQGYAPVGRTWSGLRLLTRSLAQMRRRCPAMHVDDLGVTCRTLRVKIRTSDSIALGLTRSSLWDHGVSVHAAELVQARVRWRILLEEILLCRVASTIAPESEISPSMASRAWMPCKLVCSGRSRPVPLKSPRTLRMGLARALCAVGHAERNLSM